MKFLYVISLNLIFFNIVCDGPLLVVNFITKNNGDHVLTALESYVNAGINTFFIYDLGSTDNTLNNIKEYFKEKAIYTSFIIQSHLNDNLPQNNAIDLIKKQFFPKAKFILMPNIDWDIQNIEKLIDFCKQNINKKNEAYGIRVETGSYETHFTRLIAVNSSIYFKDRFFQTTNEESTETLPYDIYFKRIHDREEIQKKIFNSEAQLFDDYIVNCLSQSDANLNDIEDIEKTLKLYISNSTNTNYKYLALYTLGKLMDLKFSQDNDDKKWHAEGFKFYFEAYKLNPERAEPLVKIAQHYKLVKNWLFAFIFAKNAVNINYPFNNLFFVEKRLYEFERYYILSIASWLIGQYKTGELATRKALLVKPNDSNLLHNLNLYIQRNSQNNEILYNN